MSLRHRGIRIVLHHEDEIDVVHAEAPQWIPSHLVYAHVQDALCEAAFNLTFSWCQHLGDQPFCGSVVWTKIKLWYGHVFTGFLPREMRLSRSAKQSSVAHVCRFCAPGSDPFGICWQVGGGTAALVIVPHAHRGRSERGRLHPDEPVEHRAHLT